jgi:hypothetical protein
LKGRGSTLAIGRVGRREGPVLANGQRAAGPKAWQWKVSASLETVLVAGAREALNAGDLKKHCGLIANAAAALDSCDAIMLAHFSMGDAAPAVQAASRRPILTAPDSAVLKLRSLLT